MTLSPEEIYDLIRESLEGLEKYMTDGAEEQAEFEVQANTNYLQNYLFAKRYGSEEVKAKYLDYCQKIQAKMRQRIEHLDWMSDATKARAQAKSDNLLFMIGYPDNWIEEALVTEEQLNDVSCYLEEWFLLARCDVARYLAIAGKPKRDHLMDYLICYKIYLHDINAYSLVSQDALFVSLSYLLPPFDFRDISEARTFASLITVGHEMTHLLDASQGDRHVVRFQLMTNPITDPCRYLSAGRGTRRTQGSCRCRNPCRIHLRTFQQSPC